MKIGEMFPKKYAGGEDLNGKAITVKISHVQPEKMRPGPGSPEETKYVVYFHGAERGVVLSRILATQIAAAVGSDDTDQWRDKTVIIFPEQINVAGRNLSVIRARAV